MADLSTAIQLWNEGQHRQAMEAYVRLSANDRHRFCITMCSTARSRDHYVVARRVRDALSAVWHVGKQCSEDDEFVPAVDVGRLVEAAREEGRAAGLHEALDVLGGRSVELAEYIDRQVRDEQIDAPQDDDTVACKFCRQEVAVSTAHLHDGEYVGADCCWDERLRATE